MKVQRECSTCEFNFDGVCAGHGEVYDYGEEIVDDTKCCRVWAASFELFMEVTKNAPWYIKSS